MTTILKLIGCRKQTGDVGIEIELEADNIPGEDSVYPIWRKEADSSLRGESAEFVLRQPIPLSDIGDALGVLEKQFSKYKTKIRPTYRAGVHVHVNVQHLTPIQLVNYMCCYFLLEEVLLRYCDETRIGNHFCLRMSDASFSLDSLVDFILNEDINRLNTEDLRYASLNITSLFKYGSVEFRALESTTDFDRINTWASVLTHLRDYAITLSNPIDLLGQVSAIGFEQIVPVILGDHYEKFKEFATDANVKRGVRNIQYAIYARDWQAKNHNIFKNKNLFAS